MSGSVRTAELTFGLVMLVFAESWGSVRTMALSHGDSMDANRELMVLGACNIGSAMMQGMAVGAGFSATSAAGTVPEKSACLRWPPLMPCSCLQCLATFATSPAGSRRAQCALACLVRQAAAVYLANET